MRRIMELQNLSQKDLANAIGVSEGQISRWLSDTNTLPRVTAMGFQAALGVRWEWLMLGQEPTMLPKAESLSVDERKLLAIFNMAPIEYRDHIIKSFQANVRLVLSTAPKQHKDVEEWKKKRKS